MLLRVIKGKPLEQMRQGLALYHPQQHRALAFVYGQDIGVVCQQWSAWALWLLGYPDQALQMTHETLQMAQEVAHPLTLAYAMTWSATVHQSRREMARAKELAESALRLATEQGFGYFMALAKIVLGEVVEPGDIAVGIARMREGVAAWRATGVESILPLHLTRLAEAYGKVGQVEEGLTVLRSVNPATGLPFEGRTEPHQSRSAFPVKNYFATRMGANANARPHPDHRKDRHQPQHRRSVGRPQVPLRHEPFESHRG